VGLPTVKRDKYSVFNFLSFPEHGVGQPPERSDEVPPGSSSNGMIAKVVKVTEWLCNNGASDNLKWSEVLAIAA
jgi:hypothetical protein